MGVMVVTMLWPLVDQAMQMHDGDASASLPLIEVPGWEVTPAGENSFAPHFEAASAVRHETLRRNDREVGLFVAYYRGQNTEHKLVTTDNVIVRNDDRTWHVIERGVRQASIGTESARVITVRIRRSDSRMLAARQWYWINGRLTSSDVLAKALIAWSRILGRGDDSAVIVLYTDAQGAGDPDQVLQAFTHEAWTHIDAALSDARAGR
jgi:EpsI family protein